jgi:molybdate transport system substrate-binding protein
MPKRVIAAASSARSGAVSRERAEEIHVLSGAAVEPGLVAAADIFRKRTGSNVVITFATTPEMRRLGADATLDVAIAPPAALDDFAKLGKVDGTARVTIGRVGVGVAIREDAPVPDVLTIDAFRRAVLDADSVVYNQASSGLYVEQLLQRLGLAEQIQTKTKRYTGTDMVEPLIKGRGKEIGFMPVAQILNWRGRGLRLVAPLPAEIQSYTTYAAAPAPGSQRGRTFVLFLGTPEAKSVFASAGVE